MKCAVVLLCVLAACGTGLAARSSQGTGTPVEKVVELLRDLKSKIELDGKTESQTYDKYACWCEKTTKRKAESITAAQDSLRALGQSMLKLKGQVATLMAEIEELAQSIQANKDAQAEATSIRQKENTAYAAETTEMKEVLVALEKAIIVLREGSKQSFLQQGASANSAVMAVIKALPASAALKPKHVSLLTDFATAKDSSKYAPQSWTVQGILRDMYQTFAADLEKATDTEATRNRDFEDLIADKTKQLQLMQTEKEKKEGEKSEAEELLADDTQSYDDTDRQMKADIAFFDKSKAACESKHSDWVTRSELRSEELQGISEALDILSGDAARELFASSIKAGKETGMDDKYDTGVGGLVSLVQVAGSGDDPSGAYAKLRASARKAHSLRVAALAVRVREAKVGHFDEVLKSIATMIQTLKDEDAADIAKRDQCKSEYLKINSTIADVKWLIRKNTAKIDKLEHLIEKLSDEKAQTIADIDDVTEQMKAMTKQRTEENTAFLNAKAEDQAAIRLLSKARAALSKYYTNHSIELGPIQGDVKGLALSQQGPDFDISADQAPEAIFSDKGKRKHESKGIVQLLTMIMEDLNDEIKNDMQAEENAQLEYEQQMAAATKLKEELEEKEANLTAMIAKHTKDKGDEEIDKADNEKDLKNEQDYKAKIKPDCDWILGAFYGRAARRATEMEGLMGAKEYLAGYTKGEAALLEKKAAFNDDALAGIRFEGIRQ